ncbi:MAG: ATP synthase subunit I [Gammaproteobacteria bacterium]|nr:ATP synthase subunit I [Gammaproteobacteria bacterium]
MQDNVKNKIAAYKILAVGAAITTVLALLLFKSVDVVAAYSALLGGVAFIAPNVLFTKYAFRHSAAASASLMVRWFYVGEAIKIIATIFIFAACFILVKQINVSVLFAVFIAMMAVNIIGLALHGTKE